MFDLSSLNIFCDYFMHRPTFKERGVAGNSIQLHGNVFPVFTGNSMYKEKVS